MTDYYAEERAADMLTKVEARFACTGKPVVVERHSRFWDDLERLFPDRSHPIWSKVVMATLRDGVPAIQCHDLASAFSLPGVDLKAMQRDVEAALDKHVGKDISPLLILMIGRQLTAIMGRHIKTDRVTAKYARDLGFVLIDDAVPDDTIGFLSIRLVPLGVVDRDSGVQLSIEVRFERAHGA